jgi:hypothetical protein
MTPGIGTAYRLPEEELDLTLLGRELRARLHTPALARWLRTRWLFEEHQLTAHPYRISLEESLHRPPDLPRAEGEPIVIRLPGIELAWWEDGVWWQTGGEIATPAEVAGAAAGGADAEIAAVYSPEVAAGTVQKAAGVAVRFGTDQAEIRVWGRLQPHHLAALYLALSEALRASGLIPMHAAVVVRNDEATALAAPSGTGKTTTLLRLLAAGWTPLAEDLAWLDPDSLTLFGWDRGIRLWPEAIERFLPHLADAPWTTDPDGKLFLSYQDLGLQCAPSARLTRVVRLERTKHTDRGSCTAGVERAEGIESGEHGEDTMNLARTTSSTPSPAPGLALLSTPTLAPLPPHEAIRTLWEATGVPLLPTTRAALARRLPEFLGRLGFARLPLDGVAAPNPIKL